MKKSVLAALVAAVTSLFIVSCRNVALEMPENHDPVEVPTEPQPDPVDHDLPSVPSDLIEVTDDFRGPDEFWEFRNDEIGYVEHIYFDEGQDPEWPFEYAGWSWDASSGEFILVHSAMGNAEINNMGIGRYIAFLDWQDNAIKGSIILEDSRIHILDSSRDVVDGTRYENPSGRTGPGESPYADF